MLYILEHLPSIGSIGAFLYLEIEHGPPIYIRSGEALLCGWTGSLKSRMQLFLVILGRAWCCVCALLAMSNWERWRLSPSLRTLIRTVCVVKGKKRCTSPRAIVVLLLASSPHKTAGPES